MHCTHQKLNSSHCLLNLSLLLHSWPFCPGALSKGLECCPHSTLSPLCPASSPYQFSCRHLSIHPCLGHCPLSAPFSSLWSSSSSASHFFLNTGWAPLVLCKPFGSFPSPPRKVLAPHHNLCCSLQPGSYLLSKTLAPHTPVFTLPNFLFPGTGWYSGPLDLWLCYSLRLKLHSHLSSPDLFLHQIQCGGHLLQEAFPNPCASLHISSIVSQA